MPSDLVLDPAKPEFRSTNLKTASVLRLHKLATIHASMIARHLGDLAAGSENNCRCEVAGSAGRLVNQPGDSEARSGASRVVTRHKL